MLDSGPDGIVLDRSAFYPGGGGQPPDHGVLLWGGVQTRIVGVRKGDVVRVWAGGSIDRGNGDQPGVNINGPDGFTPTPIAGEQPAFALSAEPAHAFALLFKTETAGPAKCVPPGKPLEIKLTKDKERLWVGFNDERGRYLDNHLGKGKRHELDPLWVRVEVIRIVVD